MRWLSCAVLVTSGVCDACEAWRSPEEIKMREQRAQSDRWYRHIFAKDAAKHVAPWERARPHARSIVLIRGAGPRLR
jgi:hypothetical protein